MAAHGRIERRLCVGIEDLQGIESVKRFAEAKSLWMLESEPTIGDETTIEQRFYLSSLYLHRRKNMPFTPTPVIRDHWGIENKVHWVLDVAMDEDINRARIGNSAQNLSLIRKVVLNLLRKDKTSKGGVQARQKRCWLGPRLPAGAVGTCLT